VLETILTGSFSVLVARIAYLSSDVILSVQPALHADSIFSPSLKRLAAANVQAVLSQGAPEVCLIIIAFNSALTAGQFLCKALSHS
jgi:hypothetical protein